MNYENIFETLDDAFYILNKKGEFIFVSHGAELMYGYNAEEFIGKTPEFVSAPGKNDLEKVWRYLEEAYNGKKIKFEFYGLKKNGDIFPKRVSLYPFTYKGEKVVIAHGQDITEYKKTKQMIENSEERYKMLFEFSPVGITVIDASGIIQDVNQTMCERMGYKREELIGKNIRIFVPNENLSLVDRNIKRILKGDILKSFLQSKRKDGGLEYILLSERKIKLLNNEWGILSVSHFITQEIKIQKALQESEETYKNLTEMLPDAVIVHSEGKIIFANRAAVEIIGAKSKEDMLEIPVLSVMHPESLEFAKKRIRLMMETKNPAPPAEEKLIRLDGKEIIAEISARPIVYNGKEAVITVIRDITKEKEILNDLRYAKEKAEESDRLKTAFLQNMSHELRTPLNAIIGFGDLISADLPDDPEQINNYGIIIKNNGKRLLELINNILEVSKIESGITDLKKSQVKLNSLLEEVYQTFLVEAETKGLKLELIKGLEDYKSSYNLDASKLVQVLNNLIGNALKFTQKGSIQFGYYAKDELLEFFVKDTGKGISKENLGKIFQRFYQTDTSFVRGYEGAGLGLSISKGLVKLMGGKIEVSSEIGKGTEFRFVIPAEKYTTPSINKIVTSFEKNYIKLKVLLAEDEKSAEYLIKAIFHNYNMDLIVARNGEEAVETIKTNPDIDLVLMDIKMPKMNGLDATKEIKAIIPDIPVVATTAYAYENELKLIKQSGCDAVVTKPIDRSELISTLKKVCKKF